MYNNSEINFNLKTKQLNYLKKEVRDLPQYNIIHMMFHQDKILKNIIKKDTTTLDDDFTPFSGRGEISPYFSSRCLLSMNSQYS